MVFHEMSHFLQLFFEKFIETLKGNTLIEKMPVLAKSMLFRSFSPNEPILQLFPEKFIEISKRDSLFETFPVLAKRMICRAFSRNEPLFATFLRKVDTNLET